MVQMKSSGVSLGAVAEWRSQALKSTWAQGSWGRKSPARSRGGARWGTVHGQSPRSQIYTNNFTVVCSRVLGIIYSF